MVSLIFIFGKQIVNIIYFLFKVLIKIIISKIIIQFLKLSLPTLNYRKDVDLNR